MSEQEKSFKDCYPVGTEKLSDYIDRMKISKGELGVTWQEIADIANQSYGKNYNESTYRRGQFKTDDNDVAKVISDEEMNLRMLKLKMREERLQTNANLRRLSREETIKEIALESAREMSSKKLLPLPEKKFVTNTNKTAILNIGDWHYGLVIDNKWNKYNPTIAKERVAKLTKMTLEYCDFHKVEKIIVAGLGDYISGIIHLPLRINNRYDVMTQIFNVAEMIAEMLAELAKDHLVEFYTVLGNHGRIDPNKKDSIQLENLERVVPWHVKHRLDNNPNVKLDPEGEFDMVTFKVNGWQFGCAHGDKDSMSSIVKNFVLMMRKPFDVIITAHKHHLGIEELNDCLVVMNPSLMGVDDYAKDLRVSSKPAQTLIMVGEKTPVDCVYYIDLG